LVIPFLGFDSELTLLSVSPPVPVSLALAVSAFALSVPVLFVLALSESVLFELVLFALALFEGASTERLAASGAGCSLDEDGQPIISVDATAKTTERLRER
jgi:hypothetical protein